MTDQVPATAAAVLLPVTEVSSIFSNASDTVSIRLWSGAAPVCWVNLTTRAFTNWIE